MNKNLQPIYPVLGLSLDEAKKVLLNNKVKIITEDNNLIIGTIIIENIEVIICVYSSEFNSKTYNLQIVSLDDTIDYYNELDFYNEFKNILINKYGEPQKDVLRRERPNHLRWENEMYRIRVHIGKSFSYDITNKLVVEDNEKLKRESFKKLPNYLFNKN